DAVPHLEAVLNFEPNYCGALHVLAECRLAMGKADEAVPLLQRLIQKDYRWSDYRAWRTLIDAQQACRPAGDALASCRDYARHAPSLENKCLLAEQLTDNGLAGEAVKLLDEALRDLEHEGWLARLRDWRWVREANRLRSAAEAARGTGSDHVGA